MFMIFTLLFAAAAAMIGLAAPAQSHDLKVRSFDRRRSGYVDGSGWEGLYSLLRKDGFNVSPLPKPLVSRWRNAEAKPTSRCGA